jgi:phage tail-like protein
MHDIPVVFHFKVEFGPNSADQDIRFQEVTGLSAEVTTEELREGGLNEYAHRIPTGAKYGNLVLKRGLVNDSEIAEWCRDAVENFVFAPKDVTVTLLNEEHEPLATWSFRRAYPVKWSVSDFKAQENALAVESLELAYSNFRKG